MRELFDPLKNHSYTGYGNQGKDDEGNIGSSFSYSRKNKFISFNIMKKKENNIKYNYNLNYNPEIKNFKDDYESIRKRVINEENNINKIDIEKNKQQINKTIINKNILNSQIV
jgi:hypothetical protein